MDFRRGFLLAVLIWMTEGSAVLDGSPDELSLLISNTKAELARSLLRQRLAKKDAAKVDIAYSRTIEMNVTNFGDLGGLFRRSGENYVVDGSHLFRIKPDLAGYYLIQERELDLEEGALFFKQIDWSDIFFFVVCYNKNYCQVRMSDSRSSLQQRIRTYSKPVDVEFFENEGEFFLLLVKDPCSIYRWTGSYFDEHDELRTSGAAGAAIIQTRNALVAVVALRSHNEKVYSKVFAMRNRRLELIQLLDTRAALDVLSYSLTVEEDVLDFVFVLNAEDSSSVYWWNGREFSFWKSVEGIRGPGRIFENAIASEHFVFFASENQLSVYRPTAVTFDLIQEAVLDHDVIAVDMREEPDESFLMIVLTGEPHSPYLVINLLPISIDYIPVSESQTSVTDPVLRCLNDLDKMLTIRDKQIDEAMLVAEQLKNRKDTIEMDRLTTSEIRLRKYEIKQMKVNPPGIMIKSTPTEIRHELKRLEEESESILESLKSHKQKIRYRIHGNVEIKNMKGNHFRVKKFNDRTFDVHNILSVTKNQTLSGAIKLYTLSTNVLTVPSINGIRVEDMLLKNKPRQEIMGEHTVASLKARHIRFGRMGRLNGTPFYDPVTDSGEADNTFPKMTIGRLEVKYINNMTAEEWLRGLLPTSSGEERPLHFNNLNVTNLTVSEINGAPWREYLAESVAALFNTSTKTFRDSKIKYLNATRINGINVKDLIRQQTRNTSAEFRISFPGKEPRVKTISGLRKFDSDVTFPNVIFEKPVNLSGKMIDFNKLDQLYWMKSRFQTIETPVTFDEITVDELEVNALNGRSIDSYVLIDRWNHVTRPLIFENVTVLGDVTLSPEARKSDNFGKLYHSAAKSSGVNVIRGEKVFLGRVETGNLTVEYINESRVELERDARNISTVVIEGDVTVSEDIKLTYLNGYHFDEVVSKALMLDDPDILDRGVFTHLTVDELHAKTINELDAEDALENLQNRIKLTIQGDLKVPEVRATSVNGIHFDDYMSKVYLKTDSGGRIKGRKTFEGPVTVKGNLDGVLNGFNLTHLHEVALSRTRSQDITGSYVVDELTANNLNAKFFGGVDTSKLLYPDQPGLQIINSDVIFNNITISGDLQASHFANSCNLSEVTELNFEKVKRFRKLHVKGDVTWEKERKNYRGISYLYKNAVTKTEEQIISGAVEFRTNVSIGKMNTKKKINGVDLEFIVEDAVYRSEAVQEIVKDTTFKGKVTAENVLILNHAIVDYVNGVDILDLDQKLVRKSEDVVIRGRKEFVSGFTTTQLNADTINGMKTDQIVFLDEETDGLVHLPPAIFQSISVIDDLDVRMVDDVDLVELLQQRMSKTRNQTVTGHMTIKGSLVIHGDAKISRINDVNVNETVLSVGEPHPRIIKGIKTFNNTVSLPRGISADTVNGFNITDIYNRAILKNREYAINGNIVFEDDVTFSGNLRVMTEINGCDVGRIRPVTIPQDIGQEEEKYAKEIQLELEKFANKSRSMIKPVIFVDLEGKLDLNVGLMSVQRLSGTNFGDKVVVDTFGTDYNRKCGLPEECFCPSQTRLSISSISPNSMSLEKQESERTYRYFDGELGMEVVISTTSLSFDARCRLGNESDILENTKIKWNFLNENGREYEEVVTYDGANLTAFLSDVKFFKMAESIYVIAGFLFLPGVDQPGTLYIPVYEIGLNSKSLVLVDEITTVGAETLDAFWTPKGTVLVIGNGYDPELFTGSVDSAIFRFNPFINKFELMRLVKTHGILSITSVRYRKDSFIFLVQKQSWPFLILKYNHEYDNYYFSQKLDVAQSRVKSNFLSAAAFTTERTGYEGDIFVGIVLSDETFGLFKYKYIEGFVEELRLEQRNVRALLPFWLKDRQYLLAASEKFPSRIFELIQQGYMD